MSDDPIDDQIQERQEHCDNCDDQTLHIVSVELRYGEDQHGYSRTPYRIARCEVCEEETTERVNAKQRGH